MENNSKQAVLSIVGIAILVIAVVGVSFAFFTYSKTGTTNNVITTGKIEFVYTEDNNALQLTNKFPQSDEDGSGNPQFTFHIVGTIPSTANAIDYQVTAVAGDVVEGKSADNRMKDSDINVYVTGDGTIDNGYDTANEETGEYGAVAGDTTGTNSFQIAHGTIPNSGVQETHDYTLTMWINDSVTISDTDYRADYRASSTAKGDTPVVGTEPGNIPEGQEDTRKVYTDMYYSLRVNVSADDTKNIAQ